MGVGVNLALGLGGVSVQGFRGGYYPTWYNLSIRSRKSSAFMGFLQDLSKKVQNPQNILARVEMKSSDTQSQKSKLLLLLPGLGLPRSSSAAGDISTSSSRTQRSYPVSEPSATL